MDLISSAMVVSAGIAVCCLLPWFSTGIRSYSKPLLIVGTLVLLATVFLDLIPEMVEIGGSLSIGIMFVSWGVFSFIHAYGNRAHDHHDGEREHPLTFLVGSLALHCFAGGMLLVTSYEVSERLAASVFLSLVAHKGFEAVSVASLMIERIRSTRQMIRAVVLYAAAFPVGVLVTLAAQVALRDALSKELVEQAAMVITSIAVGGLFGCLIQDFLLPSIRQVSFFVKQTEFRT